MLPTPSCAPFPSQFLTPPPPLPVQFYSPSLLPLPFPNCSHLLCSSLPALNRSLLSNSCLSPPPCCLSILYCFQHSLIATLVFLGTLDIASLHGHSSTIEGCTTD